MTICVELSKIPDAMSAQSLEALEPPDSFPLVYYRDNCADIQLTIDDALGTR